MGRQHRGQTPTIRFRLLIDVILDLRGNKSVLKRRVAAIRIRFRTRITCKPGIGIHLTAHSLFSDCVSGNSGNDLTKLAPRTYATKCCAQ